ncbi:hypothetical protein BECAL_02254 [Bellilinea caldifistulae]|uniref:Uncharacterized protein n=1 Tax=Bellilinea caldifistulae TaxID=360411 RepID=A0A0N8GLY6_9CHLR|nr:hypothetical protein [Bellilinea caldifistulae]KPL73802.1 hypothetical protein AC812_13480 [Bellilinea caldifistulae]GAP11071.1 hypothetical protein BECAL_02254 [Bellilinea caldifistulae]
MDDEPLFKFNRFKVIWIGRFFCVVMLLLMGAFFINQVEIFFQQPDLIENNFPLNLVFQLGMISGYVVALKNEKAGSVLIVIFSLMFLWTLGIPKMFLFFFVILISPLYFFAYHWFRVSRGGSAE